jgi:CubicO group peptidase (beta-lactamase class C family)
MFKVHSLLLAVVVVLLAGACSESSSLEGKLGAVAENAKDEGELNGNVLITRGDKVLYERSFGPADATTDVDNTAETKFLIASLSKPITATLVMQLVEAGKLTPETVLSAIFPLLRDKPAGLITIDQLLTHTSGIEELISANPTRRITPEDLVAATVTGPGAFQYSNTGYVVLVLVIEAVSAQPYETALAKGIFNPAGMTNSGVLRTGKKVKNLARGHHGIIGLEAIDLDFAPEAVDGAGSIYSTARDLWKFDRALRAGTILSPRAQALMLVQHVPDRHGYGWFLSEQGGRYYPWHAGDMAGFSASFARTPDRDEAIIVLGNTAATQAKGLQKQFLQLLSEHP